MTTDPDVNPLILEGHKGNIPHLAISPDGTMLASGSVDKSICVWSIPEFKLLFTLEGHSHYVIRVAFSANNRFLYSGSFDGTIREWDLTTRHCIRIFPGTGSSIVAFTLASLRGLLVSADFDRILRIWDISSTTCLVSIADPQCKIHGMAITPDGKWLATGGDDHRIKIWQINDSGNLARCEHILTGSSGPIESITFSPEDNQIATTGDDSIIRLWSVNSGELLQIFPKRTDIVINTERHTGIVATVTFSSDGQYLISGGFDRTIRFWSIQNGTCVYRWTQPFGGIYCIAITPNQRWIAAGADDRRIKVWKSPLVDIFPRLINKIVYNLPLTALDCSFPYFAQYAEKFRSYIRANLTETGKKVEELITKAEKLPYSQLLR
jgi:WD40 repeat protein